MEKIILDDIELSIDNYKRDFIRSEITNKRLLRLKCETVLKGKENSDMLKELLKKESFQVNVPHESLDFKGREGEISYNYTYDNLYKDSDAKVVHVLEIIEYEDIPVDLIVQEDPKEDQIALLMKRINLLEELLMKKGLITDDEMPSL